MRETIKDSTKWVFNREFIAHTYGLCRSVTRKICTTHFITNATVDRLCRDHAAKRFMLRACQFFLVTIQRCSLRVDVT